MEFVQYKFRIKNFNALFHPCSTVRLKVYFFYFFCFILFFYVFLYFIPQFFIVFPTIRTSKVKYISQFFSFYFRVSIHIPFMYINQFYYLPIICMSFETFYIPFLFLILQGNMVLICLHI